MATKNDTPWSRPSKKNPYARSGWTGLAAGQGGSTGYVPGQGIVYTPPKDPAPAAPAPPPVPTPSAPAPYTAPAVPASPPVTPFFTPDDLASMNNFWAQWDSTFRDLDKQLADLTTQTNYDRGKLDQSHVSNQSGIQDNAAARGIFSSSIKDGNTAQEQAAYTQSGQLLTDRLNNLDSYVKGVKNNFETVVKPNALTAYAAKQAENAASVPTTPAVPAAPAPSQAEAQGGAVFYGANGEGPYTWAQLVNGFKTPKAKK